MNFCLFPRILHRVKSEINGEIIVRRHLAQTILYVQGMPQSGGIVKDIWQRGLNFLPSFSKGPQVLLLGLGGGTLVSLIKKDYPQAQITSIEIDPQIAAIAQTYFSLNNLDGLEIIVDDANKVITEKRHGFDNKKFDLIVVDLYLGHQLPGFVESLKFLHSLKDLLKNSGLVVFNRLYLRSERGKVHLFETKLKKVFPQLQSLNLNTNLLLFAKF